MKFLLSSVDLDTLRIKGDPKGRFDHNLIAEMLIDVVDEQVPINLYPGIVGPSDVLGEHRSSHIVLKERRAAEIKTYFAQIFELQPINSRQVAAMFITNALMFICKCKCGESS